MTTRQYPAIITTGTDEEILRNIYDFCLEIARIREFEDIGQFTNLNQQFVAGRKTTRIPTGNSDVVASDNVGDVTNDGTYEYKLLDLGGGTLRWDRRLLDTAW